MREDKFKRRLFFLMLIAKVVALITLWFEWSTNGFSTSEFLATVTLILPLFSIYTSMMFKGLMADPFEVEAEERAVILLPRRVKKSVSRLAHWLIPLYGLLIAYLITLKPVGVVSFSSMQAIIATVESGLGVYIGQLVFAFYSGKTK